MTRLAEPYEALTDGVFCHDPATGRVLDVNEAGLAMIGCTREELLTGGVEAFSQGDAPYDAPHVRKKFEALNREGPQRFEWCGLRKSGTVVWADVSLTQVTLEGRMVAVAVARDITATKSVRASAEESSHLLESVLNAIPDLIGLLSPERYVLRYNKAGYDLVHGDADTIKGKHCYEMIGRRQPCEVCAVREALRTKQTARVLKQVPELGMILDARAYPVLDDAGNLTCVIEHLRNVTAERKTEDALRDNRRLLADILNSIPQGIFWKDDTGRYLGCNQVFATFVGLEAPDAIMGKTDDDLPWPDNEADAQRTEDQAVMTSGTSRHDNEALHTAPGGGTVWLRTNRIPLRNQDGEIAGVLGTFEDITTETLAAEKQRELELQIAQTQRLESLGLLAGGIAHDFNNLLVAILGHADLLLADMAPGDDAFEGLTEICRAAQRASKLTGQMLTYSGKGNLVMQRLNLNAIMKEMTGILGASISKKITIACEFDDALPDILADAAQVQQVVMNLVTNAGDAIGSAPGTITMRSRVTSLPPGTLEGDVTKQALKGGDYAVIEVIDTGCGMSEAVQERIFDPFFTTRFVGRGLGLSAVLGILRGHRAAVTLTSKPNHGTHFRVFFPVAEEVKKTKAPPQEAADVDVWRGSGVILVVDDEPTVRSMAGRVLKHYGFEVVLAQDGCEALEILDRDGDGIRAVLMDETMPRMDGMETLAAMRRNGSHIPVLLSSGYSENGTSDRAQRLGAQGFIQKPYMVDELMAALRGILDTPAS